MTTLSIAFLNDLCIVFFYVASSLNLFKWLVIINRVYLYAGKISKARFKYQECMNVLVYVTMLWFVIIINFSLMGMDLQNAIAGKENQPNQYFYDQIDSILSFQNSMAFIVILSALTLSMIIIGSILVHKLRQFFRENYYQHSNSIILSIFFETISITSIMAWYLIKIFKRDDLIYYSQNSIENDNWIYPLIHFGLVILG